MNMKKITAIAAAVVIAAGICTGVPTGTGNSPLMAITASANTVSQNPGTSAASYNLPASYSATGGDGKIDVKWEAVSGATSYYVSADKEQADGSDVSVSHKNVTGTSCTIDNLPADTYCVFIKPNNAEMGVSLDGVVVTGSSNSTKSSSKKEIAELKVNAKAYSDKTTDITWEEIKGAYYYDIDIYYDGDVFNTLTEVFLSTSAKKDFKIDTGFYAGNLYIPGEETVKAISNAEYTFNLDVSTFPDEMPITIRVVANDKNNEPIGRGTVDIDNSMITKRKGTASSSAKAAAPANFKAKKTNNSVTLSWDAVDGADLYRVYKYNEKTGKYEKYKDVKSAKCTVSGLSANTKPQHL